MRTLTILVLISFSLFSSITGQENLIRKKYKKNISFIRIDSTYNAQSTIIEYDDFLVLLELPSIENSNYRKKGLTAETKQGELVLNYLQKEYKKPVKYIFCSHWHLHTLSGILPYLESNCQLITTSKSWKRSVDKGVLNPDDLEKYRSRVIKVDKDTTFLSNSNYPIRLVYLNSPDHY